MTKGNQKVQLNHSKRKRTRRKDSSEVPEDNPLCTVIYNNFCYKIKKICMILVLCVDHTVVIKVVGGPHTFFIFQIGPWHSYVWEFLY